MMMEILRKSSHHQNLLRILLPRQRQRRLSFLLQPSSSHRHRQCCYCHRISSNKFNKISRKIRKKRWFSSTPPPTPQLKSSTTRDLRLFAIGTFGISSYVLYWILTSNDWDDDVRNVKNQLLRVMTLSSSNSTSTASSSTSSIAFDDMNDDGYYLSSDNSNFQHHDHDHDSSASSSFSSLSSSSSLAQPPPPVTKYIQKVFGVKQQQQQQQQQDVRRIDGEEDERSLLELMSENNFVIEANQSGEFYAIKQWFPFRSQFFTIISNANNNNSSTTNIKKAPGFVWEAHTKIFQIPNNILESYVNGCGRIITKAWGKIPLLQVEEDDPYIFFWLAMCPLYPIVLLQQQQYQGGRGGGGGGIIKWKSTTTTAQDDDDLLTIAKAELLQLDDEDTHNNNKGGPFEVEFIFRQDGDSVLLERIQVTSDNLPYIWQAEYKQYKNLSIATSTTTSSKVARSLLVPTIIEIGKIYHNNKSDGNRYQTHLKIRNHNLTYRSLSS